MSTGYFFRALYRHRPCRAAVAACLVAAALILTVTEHAAAKNKAPANEPTEAPIDAPSDAPMDEPIDDQPEDPVDEPADRPADEPADEPADKSEDDGSADEPAPKQIKILDVSVTTVYGAYEAVERVNIRAKPSTDAKRIGGLDKGELVEAVGRFDKDWLAIKKKDGKDLGFVFEQALKPIEVEEADFSIPLTPESGVFLVTKDINVHIKPITASKSLSLLKKGVRVEAVGRPEDSAWLGVKQNGKELGYVYAPVLLPIIDGSQITDIKGKSEATNGAVCEYAVRFDKRNATEGEASGTYDYDISYKCAAKGAKFEFPAFMFITEAAFDLTQSQIYQINVDVLEIGDSFEEALSTTFMYHKKTGKLVFDGISQDEFGKKPKVMETPAADIESALSAAAQITPDTWNDKTWKEMTAKNR